MERVIACKMVAIMVVLAWNVVEGGRTLNENNVKLQPENYYGSFGGTGSIIPTPFGPTIAFGPSGFCSFPGVGCVRVQPQQPTVPGGGAGGGGAVPTSPTVPAAGGVPSGAAVGSPPRR